MSRIRTTIRITAAATALAAAAWGIAYATAPAYDGTAGIAYATVEAPARGTEIDLHIWYPATPGGRAVTVGGNGVFHGTPGGRRAPHAEGQYPMVLISHGSGGNAGQFGWIAAELARAGYVVVLPNHPGVTTGDASAEAAMRLWDRPADIRAVIDAIEADPEQFAFIDTGHIAVLGFSAGGFTAMALTGARADPVALNRFCEVPNGMSDCAFFALQGIDLADFDFAPVARDMSDPRIGAAVFIDPGIIQTVTEESLEAMATPSLMINLGAPGTVPAGVDASAAVTHLADVTYAHVEGASHFSFLAQCWPRGAAILENEGELDPLCSDGGSRSRADIHAELSERITGFLDAEFGAE